MTLDEVSNILASGRKLHGKARACLNQRYEQTQREVVRLREQIEQEQLTLAVLSEEECEMWRLIRLDEGRKGK